VPIRLPSRRSSVTPARAAAAALVVLTLAAGAARLPGELSDQSTQAAAADRLARIGDLPVLAGVGPVRTRFLVLVRQTVPPTESVRIVLPTVPTISPLEPRTHGTPGVCGYQTTRTRYFWVVYALYPRPSTCDSTARWTVYYGVPPPALPATATAYRTAADLVLVRR
jgi:hypothetical protein